MFCSVLIEKKANCCGVRAVQPVVQFICPYNLNIYRYTVSCIRNFHNFQFERGAHLMINMSVYLWLWIDIRGVFRGES
jgi:hypothetical protein